MKLIEWRWIMRAGGGEMEEVKLRNRNKLMAEVKTRSWRVREEEVRDRGVESRERRTTGENREVKGESCER